MGKLFPSIDDPLRSWIAKQHLFFVATAPSGEDGHINCSPKGLDTFRVLGPNEVAYLDYTGSGVETIAHLRQNGRIVILFCAFEGPPKIVRLHGRGEAVEPGSGEFARLAPAFGGAEHFAVRSIIRIDVDRISDSCGYGVPRMRFEGDRNQLELWAEKKGPDSIRTYQATKNAESIDGIDGLRPARPAAPTGQA